MDPNKSTDNFVGTVRSSHIRSSVSFVGRFDMGGFTAMRTLINAALLIAFAIGALFNPFAAAPVARADGPVQTFTTSEQGDKTAADASATTSQAQPSNSPSLAAADPNAVVVFGAVMKDRDVRVHAPNYDKLPEEDRISGTVSWAARGISKDFDFPAHQAKFRYIDSWASLMPGDIVHFLLKYNGVVIRDEDVTVSELSPVFISFNQSTCSFDWWNDPYFRASNPKTGQIYFQQHEGGKNGTVSLYDVLEDGDLRVEAFRNPDFTGLRGQLDVQNVKSCRPKADESITISGICPTPGVDSADLSLTGVYAKNGQPVAGQAVSIRLDGTEIANVSTNGKGEFAFMFANAKQHIGKVLSAVAGSASKELEITAAMFESCVTPDIPVEGVTFNGICPTPGQDSNDLSLTGTYVKDGQPVAGQEVTINLDGAEIAKVTTDNNGKFAFMFANAKQHIGKVLSAVAGSASKELEITAAMFESCVTPDYPTNGVQISGSCPTPGKESKDLALVGGAFVDNVPAAGQVVTLYVAGKELAQVTTGPDGSFAYLFKDAKSHMGQTVKAEFNDSSDSMVITADLFTACKTRGNGKVVPHFSGFVECATLPADGNGNQPKGWVRNLVFDGLAGAEQERIISATVTADFSRYVQFGQGTKVIGIDPRAYALNQQLTAAWRVSYVNSTTGEFGTRTFDRGFDVFDPENQATWGNYSLKDELGRFVKWGGSKENKAEFIRVLEWHKWVCSTPTTERKPEVHQVCTGLDTNGQPIIATYQDGETAPVAGDCTPKPQPKPRTICAGLDDNGQKVYVPAEDDSELDSPGCTAGDLIEGEAKIAAPQTNTSGAALMLTGYLFILALAFYSWAKSVGLI